MDFVHCLLHTAYGLLAQGGAMKLQRILVPLDGSDVGERALPLVEQLAGRGDVDVILARAPLARAFSGLDAIEAKEALAKALGEAQAYLEAVAGRLQARGLRCQISTPLSPTEDHGGLVTQVARPSFPFRQVADLHREAAEAIVREAEERQVDLIIMATHGRSGLERWLQGSAALDVLNRTSVPVLLTRPGLPETLPEREALQILVPLDGSAHGEGVIGPATFFAKLLGGSLALIRVVPAVRPSLGALLSGPLAVDPVEQSALHAAAQSYLDGVQALLAEQGIRADTLVLEGDPARSIIRAVEEHGKTLIALATHGRTGLARLASERVAEALVTSAPCPVLVVRPSAGEVEEQRILPAVEDTGSVAREEPTAVVRLSAEDCEIIHTALLTLLQTTRRDDHLGEPIQRLLATIEEAQAAARDPVQEHVPALAGRLATRQSRHAHCKT